MKKSKMQDEIEAKLAADGNAVPAAAPAETPQAAEPAPAKYKSDVEQVVAASPGLLTDRERVERVQPTALRDIEALTPEQRDTLIKARIRELLTHGQAGVYIPAGGTIPTILTYLPDGTIRPTKAFIAYDYRDVQAAWDYFRENDATPTGASFLDLVRAVNPDTVQIIPRCVDICILQ